MVGLFANLMRVTLTMSALAALILFCTPLLKKRYSASWRYWVWMVITVRLLIPFQMPAIELPDLSGPFQSAISAAWTAPQDSKTQISQEAEGQTRQDAPTLQESADGSNKAFMVGLEDKASDVPMERSGSCHLGVGRRGGTGDSPGILLQSSVCFACLCAAASES